MMVLHRLQKCWMLAIILLISSSMFFGCNVAQEEQPQDQQAQDQEQKNKIEARQKQENQKERQDGESAGEAQAQDPQEGPQLDEAAIEKARYIARQVDGVQQVAAVALDQDLSVAVDVAQMNRLQLNGIRKEIFHSLRDEYPDRTIRVSTDRKVFWEMEKLEKQGFGREPNTTDMQKKLQKVNEDMKG